MHILQLIEPQALLAALGTAILLFVLSVLANQFRDRPEWMTQKRLVACSVAAIVAYALFTTVFPLDDQQRAEDQTTPATTAPLTPTTEPLATTVPTPTTIADPPDTATAPPASQDQPIPTGQGGGAGEVRPTLSLDRPAVTMGDVFTIAGSGFAPNRVITFQFESSVGIQYQLPGSAVTGTSGSFREQSEAAVRACNSASDVLDGSVLAYYGRSDLARDATGHLNQAVTATPFIIECS